MKKKTKTPEGIILRKSAKGYSAHISENGRKLSVITGYNSAANTQDGLHALYRALRKAVIGFTKAGKARFRVIDQTKTSK